MPLTIEHLQGEAAREVLGEDYVSLYLNTRAEPPYNSGPLYNRDRFLDRTSRQIEVPGFELVSARDGERLIGFAFGFPMAAGRWWRGDTTPAPDEVLPAEKFLVIELNVAAEERGKGYGRRLLDELLGGRAEPWATLLSTPHAPAHDMYEHLGWDIVGTNRPAPDAEIADVMLLKLGN
ncbi:N-acetyltransferase [Sphaerisporangium album]|uniref:N-acetyltransferase n=1 Tax=Sphaerisporangium album TaxID=509200 RepID=A0A367EKS1_9ACTN|nr:GNAT family N-acetyltransferase [Sphaerisporangium album]RCG17790.1 N-acetyltransferase [Sphaerisporangium album]